MNSVLHDARVLKTAHHLALRGSTTIIGFRERSTDSRLKQHGEVTIDRSVVYPKGEVRGLAKKLAQVLAAIRLTIYTCMHLGSADLLVCNDLETLHLAVLTKIISRGRCSVVYESHEHKSEAHWVSAWRKPIIRMWERSMLKWCDSTIVVSDSIAEDYSRLYNVRAHVVRNCPPFQQVENNHSDLRSRLNVAPSTTLFIYIGGYARNRGIEEIIEAFKGADPAIATVVFIGFGALEPMILDASEKCPSIRVLPPVTTEEIVRLASGADFGLVLTKPSCLSYDYSLPNKFYDCLMAELPVVVSDTKEVALVVSKFRIGIVWRLSGGQDLKEAIKAAIDTPPGPMKQAIRHHKHSWSWEAQVVVWNDLLQSLWGRSATDKSDG